MAFGSLDFDNLLVSIGFSCYSKRIRSHSNERTTVDIQTLSLLSHKKHVLAVCRVTYTYRHRVLRHNGLFPLHPDTFRGEGPLKFFSLIQALNLQVAFSGIFKSGESIIFVGFFFF
jgi:hypothetical protein